MMDKPFYVKAFFGCIAYMNIKTLIDTGLAIKDIVTLASNSKIIESEVYGGLLGKLIVLGFFYMLFASTNNGKVWPSRLIWIFYLLSAIRSIFFLFAQVGGIPIEQAAYSLVVSCIICFVGFKCDQALKDSASEPKEAEPLVLSVNNA